MTHEHKIARAIEYLGERYICHPSRRVSRLKPGEQIDIHKADVAQTIKKARKQIEKGEQQ